MRPRWARFTIGRLMIIVAASAVAVTPFAWTSPELRGRLLIGALTVGAMLLIVGSPFLLDRLDGGRSRGLGPRPVYRRRGPYRPG